MDATFRTSDGLSLWFEDTGPADAVPVVLLHGFAADSRVNWRTPGVFDALVGAGHRVVALDARGHGRSDKPHDPGAYVGDVMARDVSALLDQLDADACHLVGYSMGGVTALRTTLDDGRVRSAVLGGIGGGLLRTGSRRRPAIGHALLADDPSAVEDPTARAFRRFADSTGADRHALGAHMLAEDVPISGLDGVTVPTLVLVGDRDTLVGSGPELAAAIPGARAVVIGGDHLGAVADPGFVPAVLGFLDEVGARV